MKTSYYNVNMTTMCEDMVVKTSFEDMTMTTTVQDITTITTCKNSYDRYMGRYDYVSRIRQNMAMTAICKDEHDDHM